MSSMSASLGFVHLPEDLNDPAIGKIVRYDQFVAALFKQQSYDLMKLHAAGGICEEAGEVHDNVKREVIYERSHNSEGKTIREGLIEELGDLRFYMQALMNIYHICEQEILQHNALKLLDRYKGLTYSNQAAGERADKSANKGE